MPIMTILNIQNISFMCFWCLQKYFYKIGCHYKFFTIFTKVEWPPFDLLIVIVKYYKVLFILFVLSVLFTRFKHIQNFRKTSGPKGQYPPIHSGKFQFSFVFEKYFLHVNKLFVHVHCSKRFKNGFLIKWFLSDLGFCILVL